MNFLYRDLIKRDFICRARVDALHSSPAVILYPLRRPLVSLTKRFAHDIPIR
jgi:hypothetical protein